jgi:AraC family transcriptional regulator
MHSIRSVLPTCRPDTKLSLVQQQRLSIALQFLVQNPCPPPSLDELAKIAGYSKFHFHRMFRDCYGKPLHQLAMELQVERAKELVEQGVPLNEIALRCGFRHQPHFTNRFRKVIGETPAQWRRRNHFPIPPHGRGKRAMESK